MARGKGPGPTGQASRGRPDGCAGEGVVGCCFGMGKNGSPHNSREQMSQVTGWSSTDGARSKMRKMCAVAGKHWQYFSVEDIQHFFAFREQKQSGLRGEEGDVYFLLISGLEDVG